MVCPLWPVYAAKMTSGEGTSSESDEPLSKEDLDILAQLAPGANLPQKSVPLRRPVKPSVAWADRPPPESRLNLDEAWPLEVEMM